MTPQEIKEKIDGYHCLQSIGQLSPGDCADAINDLIGRPDGSNSAIYDELYDYRDISRRKFELNDLAE